MLYIDLCRSQPANIKAILHHNLEASELCLCNGEIDVPIANAILRLFDSTAEVDDCGLWGVRLSFVSVSNDEAARILRQAFHNRICQAKLFRLEVSRDPTGALFGASADGSYSSKIKKLTIHSVADLPREFLDRFQVWLSHTNCLESLSAMGPIRLDVISQMFQAPNRKPTRIELRNQTGFLSSLGEFFRDWRLQHLEIASNSLTNLRDLDILAPTLQSLTMVFQGTTDPILPAFTGLLRLLRSSECRLTRLETNFSDLVLFQALQENHTVKNLTLSRIKENGPTCCALVELLRHSRCIDRLKFSARDRGDLPLDLARVLDEENTSLTYLKITSGPGGFRNLQPFVARNWAGRRLLRVSNVSGALWPRVLGRIKKLPESDPFSIWTSTNLRADSMFYLLRNGNFL